MQSRLQTMLLIAILLTLGATALMTLRRVEIKAPMVLIMRPGEAPIRLHEWELAPPGGFIGPDCVRGDLDGCSDGPDEMDPDEMEPGGEPILT